jgi:RHS repeat-associated protein
MRNLREMGKYLDIPESDTDAGLYYYRARYYDQNSSRFLSEDPIGLNGALNFYAYVDNDPGDYDDPFGLNKYKCPLFVPCVQVPSGGHTLPYDPHSAGSLLVD